MRNQYKVDLKFQLWDSHFFVCLIGYALVDRLCGNYR